MNELVSTSEKIIFNTQIIKRFGFLRVTCASWDEPKNCLVFRVTEDMITAITLGENAAIQYLRIKPDDSEYKLIYSSDLEAIYGADNL